MRSGEGGMRMRYGYSVMLPAPLCDVKDGSAMWTGLGWRRLARVSSGSEEMRGGGEKESGYERTSEREGPGES